MPKSCSIEGCERPSRKRGWCTLHYGRWQATGDPLKTLPRGPKPHGDCDIAGCAQVAHSRGLCIKHYSRWRAHGDATVVLPRWGRTTLEARFWAKVNKDGPIPDYAPHLGPCWIWTAALDRTGYGKFIRRRQILGAHRVAYELAVGPIPDGLTLDHLCRVHACVNPTHLEPVTQRENTMRGTAPVVANAAKTHCTRGHEFTPENTYRTARGTRSCRACHRDYERAARAQGDRPVTSGSRSLPATDRSHR